MGCSLLKPFTFCAAAKATTVGYGRHLLASAPAPAMTKATTVGYGRHLLAAMAPAPMMMMKKAAAPAPGGTCTAFLLVVLWTGLLRVSVLHTIICSCCSGPDTVLAH